MEYTATAGFTKTSEASIFCSFQRTKVLLEHLKTHDLQDSISLGRRDLMSTVAMWQ